MNIAQIFGLKNPPAFASKHGETGGLPMPDMLVGIELEIENFPVTLEHSFGGFTFTTDGSLRASDTGVGIEAITKPVAIKYVPGLLNAFYQRFGIKESNYSERCSTHVHFNTLGLELEQVKTICLLYQTVERLLFRYIGHDRGENIFCVPWYQCNMSYNIVNQMSTPDEAHNCFRRWQKYSAMNLIPVVSQGTLEFRHLHGTCDVKLITEWISLVAKMFEYATKTPFAMAQDEIVNMNTVSNYHEWLNGVFGSLASALHSPNFEKDLATGVIDSKLMITKKEEKKYAPYDIRPLTAARIIEDDLVAGLGAAPAWPTFARDAQAAQVAAQAAPNFLWGDPANPAARVDAARPVARPRARPLTAAQQLQAARDAAVQRLIDQENEMRAGENEEEGDF